MSTGSPMIAATITATIRLENRLATTDHIPDASLVNPPKSVPMP